MAQTINLFEYEPFPLGQISGLPDDFKKSLNQVLHRIWSERKRFVPTSSYYPESKSKKQNFIEIKEHELICGKWIGSVNFSKKGKQYNINLLPKIFHRPENPANESDLNAIFSHILWWLSESEKEFPTSQSNSMQGMQSDLLEVMIHIFSSYALEVFSTSTHNSYEEVFENTENIRGKIDFSAYSENYGRGNRHTVSCTYDSFQFDNRFNQIVRYVCKLLSGATSNQNSRRNLEEIIFLFDEVSDIRATVEDCDKVKLNPIHSEFKTILDHCRMFLSSLSTFRWNSEFEVFALLIPAENLFENFIYSMLKKVNSPNIKRVSRSTGNHGRTHLVRQIPRPDYDRFQMRHDIVVKTTDRFLILDTKYKKIYPTEKVLEQDGEIDRKYNISRSDIYQMVSYAVGSGVDRIALIYPSLINDKELEELPVYEIMDEFSKDTLIKIYPFKVNIMHEEKLSISSKGRLEKIFENSSENLRLQLDKAVERMLE
jgi:5-methylcytosine-specific restriction enzyme subunit McrC